MDPDPDPGGPKTCGSGRSGFGSRSATLGGGIIIDDRVSNSVADPDPGYGAFLTTGSGMGKKSESGSGMNNPDYRRV